MWESYWGFEKKEGGKSDAAKWGTEIMRGAQQIRAILRVHLRLMSINLM